MIGYYDIDVYSAAMASPDGHITVDFLNGSTIDGTPTKALIRALALYREALRDLCQRHGGNAEDFKQLTVRFGTDRVYGNHFTVNIRDITGRSASDVFFGISGKRIKRKR